MDLPILGQTGPDGPNGSVVAIDRKYAVELTTADGETHVYAFRMGRPKGPDGTIDLAALTARCAAGKSTLSGETSVTGDAAELGTHLALDLCVHALEGVFEAVRHAALLTDAGALLGEDQLARRPPAGVAGAVGLPGLADG